MKNILNEEETEKHTKEIIKIARYLSIALLFLMVVLFKFNALYKVTANGEELGYVRSKNEIQNEINKILESKEDGVAFKNLEIEPVYELKFVSNKEKNEDEVINKLKENISTTYTAYGITVDDKIQTYVDTEEEADNIAEDLQKEYEDKMTVEIGVKQVFEKEKIKTLDTKKAIAKLKEDNLDVKLKKLEEKEKKEKEEKAEKAKKVVVAVRPISGGTITSRYGERSSIRSSTHTGLDLAAPKGTTIKAAATGKVTFAGYNGSYGYMIKIKCDNGYEMWYAHCSKLYAKKGQRVSAGTKIAAVGSTGNSTGPHLHFEIRKNGKTINPQKYL